MLILKYERLDFFNHRIYTEDAKQDYNKEDLKKVFAYFNKTHDASIQIDNVVVFWDSLTEYENKVVTVRNYDGMNYVKTKKSYDKVKKIAMQWYDGLMIIWCDTSLYNKGYEFCRLIAFYFVVLFVWIWA